MQLSLVGPLTAGAGAASDCVAFLWDSFLLSKLPLLGSSIGDVPSLTLICYAKASWHPWEAPSSLRRKGNRMGKGRGEREGLTGGEGK